MRPLYLPVLFVLAAAAPLAAQSRRDGPELGRQGPTVVAEPVAVALAAFDADQDGLVTRAEASAGAARSFAQVAKGAPDLGYIGYSVWATRYLGDANAAPGPYAVDEDRNNRVSAAELSAAILGAFDRFDTNHDTTLTRAELITVRATVFGDDGQRQGKGKAKPAAPPRQ